MVFSDSTVSSEYLTKASALISDHQYLMLSKSWCKDCHYVDNVLQEFGVADKVHIIELDKFEDQNEATLLEEAFTQITGRKWVPSIFFNGKYLGTERDLKEWKDRGTLEDVFKREKIL